jgi:histidinol dehydrogenase
MKLFVEPNKADWDKIAQRPVFDQSHLEAIVLPVIDAIKQKGDAALREFTAKFDGVDLENLLVSDTEFEEANNLVSKDLKDAIEVAFKNIETFHRAQKENFSPIETMAGVKCWRESRPIEKVGLYIPGGTAPLFSTILMLAIPAQIAGCKEIVLCSPPNKEGKIHPAILYAAHRVGVTKLVKAGGSQAIAAMACGTETVPKVYKIFGPGNQYVTAAKQLVNKLGTAIDMPAGPSEVQVIADNEANVAYVASDLLSQAEHGVDSQVILVTHSEKKAQEILKEVDFQLSQLPRKELAVKALENSKTVVLSNFEDVVSFTNLYAPEHLIIQTENYSDYISQITNAGSVFLGSYTPESAGDYASGTNHTLPTNGYARTYSGVSLDSFVKKITFQEISKEGLQLIGKSIEIMAEAEELIAHKNAVSIRLK